MFEDFEVETLEHQDTPYKGKKGDYIMISPTCEMYVVDQKYFEDNYEVKNFWDIKQYAQNLEDFHFGLGFWKDSPFNNEAIELLRQKKISKHIKDANIISE